MNGITPFIPSEDDFVDSPLPITRKVNNKNQVERLLPFSEDAEKHVIACCLIDDGITLSRCIDDGLTPQSFYLPANRCVFQSLVGLKKSASPISTETLLQELIDRNTLESVGGVQNIVALTSEIPTTAHASHFIARIIQDSGKREIIRRATEVVERAYNGTSLEEIQNIAGRITENTSTSRPQPKGRGLFQFNLCKDGDQSILLGDRYLNRGDGGIFVGSSGMGKSSGSLQMAVELALNMGPFGIKGNGPLTSLVIQSEDTDGDVAEVAYSMKHVLKLTNEQMQEVNRRVIIVTDRTNRGVRFIASLKRLIEEHKPDIAWINPLQAFLDGDVTESKDVGLFLREQLNSLNEPPTFGYMLVHHTTKPATGKNKGEREWHEVMYDMAGGAEIINWARLIISLRATPTEGEFNLVLAKRGRRAGVTKKVPRGNGFILEPLTVIPIRHAKGHMEVEGIKRGIPLIHWEPREEDTSPESQSSTRSGKSEKYNFSDYAPIFPSSSSEGLDLNKLHRAIEGNNPIVKGTLHNCLKRWAEQGHVEVIINVGQLTRYRLKLVNTRAAFKDD